MTCRRPVFDISVDAAQGLSARESENADTCPIDGLMHHRLLELARRMDDLDMKRVVAKSKSRRAK